MDEGFVFDPRTSNAQFTLKELLCQENWETIDWSSAHLGFYHLLAEIHWASTGWVVLGAGIGKINNRVSAF